MKQNKKKQHSIECKIAIYTIYQSGNWPPWCPHVCKNPPMIKCLLEFHHVDIMAREDRWFERGVKESIYVKLERPSLNTAGSRQLLVTHLQCSTELPPQHSHLDSPSHSNAHEDRLDQSVRLHAQFSQITAIFRLRYSIGQLQSSEYTCR